jgi:hypothetical protein
VLYFLQDIKTRKDIKIIVKKNNIWFLSELIQAIGSGLKRGDVFVAKAAEVLFVD